MVVCSKVYNVINEEEDTSGLPETNCGRGGRSMRPDVQPHMGQHGAGLHHGPRTDAVMQGKYVFRGKRRGDVIKEF